ncbi:LysR family transcriptional regulator [Rhodobacterales bacterium]|nr:LysR family transcriptional regulator [Rhodobacterales bacterium]
MPFGVADMELKQLEYFRKVARIGSFSQASAVLMIVQPALSRQVSKLEDEIGTKLFYRNGRGVTLTDAGRRFLEVADRVLDDLDNVRAELNAVHSAPCGTVTLGIPPSVSAMIGAPLLMRLRRNFPKIRLHMIDGLSGHICEWMTSGKIDIGIIHDARQSTSLLLEPLLSEPLYVVGQPSTAHGLKTPDSTFGTIELSQAARLPLVLQGQGHGLRRLIDRTMSEAGLDLNVEMEIDAVGTISSLAQAEDLYGILPLGCVVEDLRNGRISAWRIVDPTPINVMLLATVPHKPFSPAMREVRKAIQQEIAALQLDQPQPAFEDFCEARSRQIRAVAV